MPENSYPEYLYHYTTVENLALILKNRTIRFSSLDRMDDHQENEAADIKNLGQFIYVSSWTADEDESIPMWNMYASIKSGVRIRMKSYPFKLYEEYADDIRKVMTMPVTDNSGGKPVRNYIRYSDMIAGGYVCMPMNLENALQKVTYTDDKDKLYPRLAALSPDGSNFTISMSELGRNKNRSWSFQDEWRYIITIFPLDINQSVEQITTAFTIMSNKILRGLEKQKFPFYDMYIDDAAFDSMEVTLSPAISAGERTIVDALKQKYAPKLTIRNSILYGTM